MRRIAVLHSPDPDVSAIASLIADPVRGAMLCAMLDGRESCASDLARRAGTSPQAASAHLGKLVAGGLLIVRSAGRRRLFKLASAQVAHALESLALLARPKLVVALSQNNAMQRLREARSCYDHLAGRLGVAVTERFIERDAIRLSGSDFEVTPAGEKLFRKIGLDVDAARRERRSFARACIDWTERRPHLAGSLGAQVLALFESRRWVRRDGNDRGLQITREGRDEIEKLLSSRS
jgi:DNA-binding transcriptional ArsR family regulator